MPPAATPRRSVGSPTFQPGVLPPGSGTTLSAQEAAPKKTATFDFDITKSSFTFSPNTRNTRTRKSSAAAKQRPSLTSQTRSVSGRLSTNTPAISKQPDGADSSSSNDPGTSFTPKTTTTNQSLSQPASKAPAFPVRALKLNTASYAKSSVGAKAVPPTVAHDVTPSVPASSKTSKPFASCQLVSSNVSQGPNSSRISATKAADRFLKGTAVSARPPPLCSNPRIGIDWYDTGAQHAASHEGDDRLVVFFDIDNTLYSQKMDPSMATMAQERIQSYFASLGLSKAQVNDVHARYWKEYGLALRELSSTTSLDPLEFDARCDASLPLEQVLKPDTVLQSLLSNMDRTRCRVVALTNSYKTHANRVLSLLGVKSLFEACVYCDYARTHYAAKPDMEFYLAAMDAVGVHDYNKCFFVDDHLTNVQAAKTLGWHSCIYFDESFNQSGQQSEEDQELNTSLLNPGSLIPTAERTEQNGGTNLAQDILTGPPQFNEVSIHTEFAKLSHPARIHLVDSLFGACTPGELMVLSRSLDKHLRKTRDSITSMSNYVHQRIFSYLDVPDLLHCRQVCTKWKHLSHTPWLWRRQALRLTWGDPVPLAPPDDEREWEQLVKGLFWRERNWAQGLAQTIDFFQGHTGYVTSIKIKGRTTLVTGSYDETVRVWDLRTGKCTKALHAKAISCLDFLPEENILCAGLYDTGRVMVWDMKSWNLLQTLSGHNKGIRNVALSKDYLISCGQDKAIVVWDWKTGTKIVRLGQQSNVSLGVSIVDVNKIVAVTVDGIIRTFSIPQARMIQQFDLRKLGGPSTLGSDKAMLQWFHASAKTITVASKETAVHLQWQEHYVPVEEYTPPYEIRKIVSARSASQMASSIRSRKNSQQFMSRSTSRAASRAVSRADATSSMGMASPSRSPSSMSNRSTATPGSPSTPIRTLSHTRSISNLSTPSIQSHNTLIPDNTRSPDTSLAQRTTPSSSAPKGRLSSPAVSTLGRGPPPGSDGKSQTTRSASTSTLAPLKTDGQPAPSPTTRGSARRASATTPRRQPQYLIPPHEEDESLSTSDVDLWNDRGTSPLRGQSHFDSPAEADESSKDEKVYTGPMRYAPNLAAPPKVVEVLHSPDMATGAVDAAKQRIVCSTFSSRAGSDRRLYVSTYHTRDPVLEQNKHENQTGHSTLDESKHDQNPCETTDPVDTDDLPTGTFVPIGGVWLEREQELQARNTRPLAMVVDHESIVVGCQDGTLYRIGFVGNHQRPPRPVETPSSDERLKHHDGVDYVIDDLSLLKHAWAEIMLPPDALPDHPGRRSVVQKDPWVQLGLK